MLKDKGAFLRGAFPLSWKKNAPNRSLIQQVKGPLHQRGCLDRKWWISSSVGNPSQSWAGVVGGRTTVRTTQIQNLNWERPLRSSPQVYEDGRRCRFSLPIPVSLGRKAESEFLVTLQNPRFLDQMHLGKHWQNKVKEDSSLLWFSTGH